MRWRVGPVALCVGGSTITAIALALPWAASGRRWRSAVELIRVVRDVGLADGALAAAFAVAVSVAPVIAAGTWVAAAMRTRALVAVLGGSVAVVGLLAAIVVLRSPLEPGPGVWIAIAASATALTGVGLLLRGDEPDDEPDRAHGA